MFTSCKLVSAVLAALVASQGASAAPLNPASNTVAKLPNGETLALGSARIFDAGFNVCNITASAVNNRIILVSAKNFGPDAAQKGAANIGICGKKVDLFHFDPANPNDRSKSSSATLVGFCKDCDTKDVIMTAPAFQDIGGNLGVGILTSVSSKIN